ncbi:CocE/NonD family hydrolase [Actinosynnema sp. NPDC020468]|uniref:CocE/NonD family hydrolase n=1 Tax=Actinosynnema sp. NPDC020468 TaxID=3154488 RepID=UPI0033D062FE
MPEKLAIPVGDGAVLAALLHRAGPEPAPVVVTITPYRKESGQFEDLTRTVLDAGCHHLVADARGFGASTGPYEGVLSPREIEDGAELLEWTADQVFCTGRTALAGGSYSGINQLLIATRKPRGLRCVTPWIAPTDTYRDMWKRGGIPSHTAWGAGAFLNAQRAATRKAGLRHFYVDLLESEFDGDLFHRTSVDFAELVTPALFVGGWRDYFLRGTVRGFASSAAPKRLFVGNWSHEPTVGPELAAELAAWFGFWLRDEGPDPTEDNVRLAVFGTDEWETLAALPEPTWDTWSPVAEPVEVPVAEGLATTPFAPPTTVPLVVDLATGSGMRLWGELAAFDLPITEPTRLLGQVGLTAALDVEGCGDADLHARISLVRDGEATQVTEGRLRLSHRAVDRERSVLAPDGGVVVPWHPHDRAEPLPAGPFTADVEIYPVHLHLEPGDVLRLGVTLTRADESTSDIRARVLPGTAVRLPTVPRCGGEP